MKRLIGMVAVVSVLALPGSAFGFHHVAVPGDDCAPAQADKNGGPSNNTRAAAAQVAKNPVFNPPLPPAGTPGDVATPATCPAP